MRDNGNGIGDDQSGAGRVVSADSVFTFEDNGSDEEGAGSRGNGDSSDSGGSSGPFGHGYFPDGRPRKRAPRGSLSAKKKTLVPNLEAINRTLVFLHAAMATIARTPELCIDDNEAAALSEASFELMETHGISPDPRALAWVNFFAAVSGVYGPRIAAVGMRVVSERRERAQPRQTGINGSAAPARA